MYQREKDLHLVRQRMEEPGFKKNRRMEEMEQTRGEEEEWKERFDSDHTM